MKILVLPRDANPYQELLYTELRYSGAKTRYVGELTPSHTLNLLLLPAELLVHRLSGARILHLHWVFVFALPGGRATRFPARLWYGLVLGVARLCGLRLVWTAHNVLPHNPVFTDDAAARRRLVRASDLVISHTPHTLAELEGMGARPAHSAVIAHGAYPAPSMPRPAAEGRFLFAGMVTERKGVDDLVAAFTVLPADLRATLTIAGACDDQALEARLRRAAAGDGRIRLRLERIPEDQLADLFAAADFVVLPFRRVTTSGSALLALSHGRPLIIPPTPALADLPTPAVVRYDGTVTGLSAVLARAAAAPPLVVQGMSEAALAYAREHRWENIAATTYSEFEALLARPAGPVRSFISQKLRRVRQDALYRGSLLLLANTVGLAGFGFLFWTLAARGYSPGAVGWLAGVTAGVNLLAAIATLGLPNTVIRHLARTANAHELVTVSVTAVALVGGALALLCLVLAAPLLPGGGPDLGGSERGLLLVIALVVCTAVGGTVDAGLIATRAIGPLLIKNLVGSALKVAALLTLSRFGLAGLILAYGTGTIVSSALGAVALLRRLPRDRAKLGAIPTLRRHLSFSSGNYLGTVFGILPSTVVPLEVLSISGSRQTAWFAVAFQLAGFINFIPSTAAQVTFAEAQRGALRKQLAKAIKAVYLLLLPAVAVALIAAPYLLHVFGSSYSDSATGCLRMLALSALVTGGNYLVDAALIARDRTSAYILMNAVNAVLVLVVVGILLPHGLTAGAAGWLIAQTLSLVIGVAVVATSFDLRRPVATAGQLPG